MVGAHSPLTRPPPVLWGALSADVLAEVAGHPVRTPLAVLHGGHALGQRDKHLLLLAEDGAHRPFAVLKWARGADAAGLYAEQAALAQVRALPDALLRAACVHSWGPFPLAAGTVLTVDRYVAGDSAYAQLRTSAWPSRLVARHFRDCAAWYVRFAAATRRPAQPFSASLFDEAIAAPLQALTAHFGAAIVPPTALTTLWAAAQAVCGRPVARTAEHGDLWPANLLLPRSGHGLYVLDWEHFRPATLPGFDLLLFATSYALNLPWRPFGWMPPATALARAYFQPTWLRPPISAWLEQGCAAAGLPPALIPLLMPAMLARMALRYHTYHAAATDPPSDSLWLAALRAWWTRPADNWLEAWAAAASPPQS
ncbi:MAG: choline kinase family protein [Chloroflexota bacterium]|nr:choline kinase family protein [Chloroflexota bacterium]